jgi:D-alanyl-D-alanine carboxypeptidase/D-alanyl-D-alanine-endopeptidase (penicillin-binding protein 4)
VTSLGTGETWYATNAGTRFIPASTAKLFTAALFLDQLGPQFTFRTPVRIRGELPKDGILRGPLWIEGVGDPTRSARWNQGRWEQAFAPVAETLAAAGVRRIEGDLICDESRFRTTPLGRGWDWDDAAYSFAPSVSALSAEDNCVRLRLLPGSSAGSPVTVQMDPLSAGFQLENQLVTSPSRDTQRLELQRLPGRPRLTLRGSLPAGTGPVTESTPVPDPARWFGDLLRETLQRRGVRVSGSVVVLNADDRLRQPLSTNGWTELVSLTSPPASEVVREMVKSSQNLYAQLLWLAAGAAGSDGNGMPEMTTDDQAATALGGFLRGNGFVVNDVLLEEGSGLSRRNLATPRSLVHLLRGMSQHRCRDAWRQSFPVGGVDGTLARRFTRPPTLGNVRAKTGTLRYTGALAGYLTNAVGTPLAFSIMANGFVPTGDGPTVRDEIDRWVEILAQSRVP